VLTEPTSQHVENIRGCAELQWHTVLLETERKSAWITQEGLDGAELSLYGDVS
jgi:hypothetical protein